jgi:hypothetical protein
MRICDQMKEGNLWILLIEKPHKDIKLKTHVDKCSMNWYHPPEILHALLTLVYIHKT